MTATEFKAWFSGGQFNTVANSTVTAYLTRATPYFNVTRWGRWYSEGVANWVAHSLIVDAAEATESITEIDSDDSVADSIGPISSNRSAANVELMAKDPFMRTNYGRRYCHLRRLVGMGGAVV